MTTVNKDGASATFDGDTAASEDLDDSVTVLAVVSIALSGLRFLTLLRLAERRADPGEGTWPVLRDLSRTISGTVLGLTATRQASDSEEPGKGLLLGASGAVLGLVTAVLNFNWMRTRRRL